MELKAFGLATMLGYPHTPLADPAAAENDLEVVTKVVRRQQVHLMCSCEQSNYVAIWQASYLSGHTSDNCIRFGGAAKQMLPTGYNRRDFEHRSNGTDIEKHFTCAASRMSDSYEVERVASSRSSASSWCVVSFSSKLGVGGQTSSSLTVMRTNPPVHGLRCWTQKGR